MRSIISEVFDETIVIKDRMCNVVISLRQLGFFRGSTMAVTATREFLLDAARNAGLGTADGDLLSEKLADHLDKVDPLRDLRNEFHYPKMRTLPHVDLSMVNPDDDSIYLCGNSLGLMPKATERYTQEQFKKWAEMGVFGHMDGPVPWAYGDECCTEGVAKLVGAEPSEIALMNGLTVNIHVLLTAFYKPTAQRHKILMESRAFPSDHYAVESQIRLKGFDATTSMVCLEPREGEELLRTEDIVSYIRQHGDSIAVVYFSGVQYYTGQLFDMPTITAAGHEKGCLVGWDLAHAFVNVPLKLHEWDVDFACWCSYKYGCTGAGGLAGVFVHSRFANDQRERMLGWWSHKMSSRFQMTNVLELESGAGGYRISNPPVMLVVAVLGFLDVMAKTSLEELRRRSLQLTGYLEFLIDYYLAKIDGKERRVTCEILTPRDPNQRGCQLSLKFSCDISKIYQQMVKRGVAVDKRYPYVIRVAPVHLYNSYKDVWRFVQQLMESVKAVEEQNAK